MNSSFRFDDGDPHPKIVPILAWDETQTRRPESLPYTGIDQWTYGQFSLQNKIFLQQVIVDRQGDKIEDVSLMLIR